MARKTNKELQVLKENARLRFMAGEPQKEIAKILGISEQTMSSWVSEGKWKERRAAQSITRPELINKLLLRIDNILESVLNSDNPEKELQAAEDKIAKLTASIERLDKKANVVDIIEIFIGFGAYLNNRATYDGDLSADIIKSINTYQNYYVNELLSNE